MADNSTEKPEAAAPVASAEETSAPEPKVGGEGELAAKDEGKPESEAPKEEAREAEEPKEPESAEKSAEIASEKPNESDKNPSADPDTEMKDAADTTVVEGEGDTTIAAPETPAVKGKNRRKSTAGESKTKTLNRKGSKARLTHIDAQPGDHFLVKLKGFPAWPAIICDEDMLPQALVNSRPVSAARPDGSYSEAYADGGKRVHDRSFPVMYLYTNEFGWISNTALSELTAEKARESIAEKMRKDLRAAFELASEHNSVEHYKDILKSFQEELIAQEEARKEAAATPKKPKKGKTKANDEDDEDVDMADADEAPKSAKSKKRKAEDEASTPQRPDSVKKPKIKLNTSSTPKTANGAATPKGKDASASKAPKAKAKKAKEGKEGADKKTEAPKEAKLTPEERHKRKEKEVLYLRHKLQRGLLKAEPLQEDEMESMSSFITMLENFNDLEGSIIRNTKINKVLRNILRVESIPREDDFNFKKRSQSLLDKWSKLIAADAATTSANGVNGASESKSAEKQARTNGAKGDVIEEPKKAESEKAAAEGSKDASDKVKTKKTKTKEVQSKDGDSRENETEKAGEKEAEKETEKETEKEDEKDETESEKETEKADGETAPPAPEPVEAAA